MEEISSCEAFKVIETLVAIGHITQEAAAAAKQRFERLHAAATAAAARERQLAERSHALKAESEASDAAAHAAQLKAAEFEGVSIEVLKEDVEAAQSEAALANERCALLALEASELARHRDELAEHLEGAAEAHAAMLRPLIAAARADLDALTDEAAARRAAAAAAAAEAAGAAQRGAALEAEVAEARKAHRAEANRLLGVQARGALPDKARRQADLAVADLVSAQQLLAAAGARLADAEAGARGAVEAERQKQAQHVEALSALERTRILAEAKERIAADVGRDAELAAVEAERVLADGAGLDVALRALQFELRQQRLAASAALRSRDAALRGLKAAGEALAAAEGELPQLRAARSAAAHDGAAAGAAAEALRGEAAGLRREVDVGISKFMQEETLGKDKTALYGLLLQELALSEGELAALKGEARQRARLLGDITAQHDRRADPRCAAAARQSAQGRARVKAALGAVRTQSRQVEDMRLMRAERTRRSRDFKKLYDLVRSQRNKFVALIAATGQAHGEMAGRLRLAAAEAGVLQGDAAEKARLARQQRAGAAKERDALRSELHALGAQFRARHEAMEEAGAAIGSLDSEVGRTGRDMEAARMRYEAAIEARNNTGLILIDRGDEQSVLFERSHALEARLKAGAVTLNQRESEVRALQLQVAELERSVAATRRALPDVDGVDAEVAALKAGLLLAQRESEALSLRLEDPRDPGRCRPLGGRAPDREELVARLQTLEERLGMKREELSEKVVVLDEVTDLTEALRSKAAATRGERAAASHAANGAQQRLRAVTGRIMAAISELSLYQATALRLHGERAALEELVAAARERLAAGLAPTEDSEGEWQRLQREAATVAELRRRREEEAAVLDAKGQLLDTSAEPRPNAYVPDDLGIPRPYGAFSPFKPAAPGATMRHTRPPAPREVVI
ncbi:MAG: coiled-coil flagellar protein, move backward only 2 [Monoraphidium minutum]|nr:MAG: coiled-coil flagellar protein, move backward only 2 [Monoraphidium minutum]